MHNASEFDNLVAISNLLNEHNKRQGVAYSAITYLHPHPHPHPPAEPSNHKWGSQQRPEMRPKKPKEDQPQPILSNSAYSNTLRHQLHISCAQEERVHADIHAAARCAEVEATAFKLRAELATAMDRAQTIQEQLQNQTKLASSKDHIIQSVTEESQMVQTKLKDSTDKIVRLSLKLRSERILRLREKDEQSDQQSRMRDCHEAEIRRIAREAWNAQEKLATLHDLQSRIRTGQYSPVYGVLPTRAPSPMLEAVHTGECPTSRGILPTDTPPVSSAINSDSSWPTKTAQDPSLHDWGDSSTLQVDHVLQISACFDQVSHVAESHVATLEELLQRICQLESERSQHVMPPDKHSLEKELTATMEKLRVTEEEVLTLRRNLGQSRKAMCDMDGHTRDVGHELNKCQAKLREAEDERRAMKNKFAERLCLLSAELDSTRAQVGASQLECSEATSISTALQERINDLEFQVSTLKRTRNYPPTTTPNANSSPRASEEASRRPHTHGQADPSTPSSAFHLQFSTCYHSTFNIAKDPRPSLEESSESALRMVPTEPGDRNLGKNLTATIHQLRLVKEDIVALQRDLDQSKDPPVQEAVSQDLADPSTCQTVLPRQISLRVDQVSDVTKDHRTALRELIHRACELGSESSQDMMSTKPDNSRLDEELEATTEQLRSVEEEVAALRHNLDQSRILTREAESQVRDLAHKLENCQAELQESRVKRHAGNLRFVKVVERLRLRSAALESSRQEVDALRLRYSQAKSLSAIQLDRIDELEAQLTTLESARSYPSTSTASPDSPLRAPQYSGKSPSQHLIDQRAKLQAMIEYMRRPEPGTAQDVHRNKHDDRRLEEKLATTMGLLRLAEEDIFTLRHDLDQSRKTMWDVENHADDIVNSFRTKLIKSEDARQALENKFVEAVENLRLRSAELEASMVEVEASQFKSSQVMFLSAALQERVDELEGEVKLLKGTRDYLAPTVAPSPSLFVTDTGMVSPPSTQYCALILDFEAISRNDKFIDSTYITVPASLTQLLDLSLPHSPSLSKDDSLYFGQHGFLAILPACVDSSHQDHIHGSEAEVTTSETQDYSTTTPAHIRSDSSLPRVLTDTGMFSLPSTQSCALI